MFKGGLKPALLFVCVVLVTSARAQLIRWVPNAPTPSVEVYDPAPGATLAVYVVAPDATVALPAMAGELRARPRVLCFEPRFPFVAGVHYRAEYRVPGARPVDSYFELPAPSATPATSVVQVFPSAETLPENQLKFYVQFSAPMRRGHAYAHVRVRDASGAAIELPFLELDEELWDPTFTRLTLLIDPGRIKRGVKPLEDIGPVFEAGKRYTLTIDPAWPDAEGRPLLRGFVKPIHAQPADRTPPDPARWKIDAPAAGGRTLLVVSFDEPMDAALAQRMIRVAAADGRAVAGEATLGAEERSWRFVPAQPWSRGAYDLAIETTIEDLAGNNIGKAFDVDAFERVQRRIATPSVKLRFDVK